MPIPMFPRYLGLVTKIFIGRKNFATKISIADKKNFPREGIEDIEGARCSAVLIKFGRCFAEAATQIKKKKLILSMELFAFEIFN